jgi:hypothetical protein
VVMVRPVTWLRTAATSAEVSGSGPASTYSALAWPSSVRAAAATAAMSSASTKATAPSPVAVTTMSASRIPGSRKPSEKF